MHVMKLKLLNFSYKAISIINFENKKKYKFYCRHFKLVSRFKVGLKSILQEGFLGPEFYGVNWKKM